MALVGLLGFGVPCALDSVFHGLVTASIFQGIVIIVSTMLMLAAVLAKTRAGQRNFLYAFIFLGIMLTPIVNLVFDPVEAGSIPFVVGRRVLRTCLSCAFQMAFLNQVSLPVLFPSLLALVLYAMKYYVQTNIIALSIGGYSSICSSGVIMTCQVVSSGVLLALSRQVLRHVSRPSRRQVSPKLQAPSMPLSSVVPNPIGSAADTEEAAAELNDVAKDWQLPGMANEHEDETEDERKDKQEIALHGAQETNVHEDVQPGVEPKRFQEDMGEFEGQVTASTECSGPSVMSAPSQDEHEGETRDDFENDHKQEHEIALHDAKETNVHEDEQPQLVEAVVPVNGEAPSPPSEAPVEPDVPEASVGTILVNLYTMAGENICQVRVHEVDQCTVYGLKKLVAEHLRTSPYQIDLIEKCADVLDDYVIVTRLPRGGAVHELSFQVVQSLSKARGKVSRREMLLLGFDEDAESYPSTSSDMHSHMGIVP